MNVVKNHNKIVRVYSADTFLVTTKIKSIPKQQLIQNTNYLVITVIAKVEEILCSAAKQQLIPKRKLLVFIYYMILSKYRFILNRTMYILQCDANGNGSRYNTMFFIILLPINAMKWLQQKLRQMIPFVHTMSQVGFAMSAMTYGA